MSDLLLGLLSLGFLGQVVAMSLPFVLAAMAGVVSERAGVVALGLEGKLVIAAFAAALGADLTGSVLGGALFGVAGGVAYAALYGLVVLALAANQIVAGIAMNLMAFGLTRVLLKLFYDSTANSPDVPGLTGSLLTRPLFYLALVTPLALHLGLERTRVGLRLRAVGERPDAAGSLGVSVVGIRWRAVLLGGGLAGLGGAWLALDNHRFVAEMSGGRGYIALAAVIMGRWQPLAAAGACLMFGFAEALKLQVGTTLGDVVPGELIDVLPYLLTMVALAGFMGRSRAPGALGKQSSQ